MCAVKNQKVPHVCLFGYMGELDRSESPSPVCTDCCCWSVWWTLQCRRTWSKGTRLWLGTRTVLRPSMHDPLSDSWRLCELQRLDLKEIVFGCAACCVQSQCAHLEETWMILSTLALTCSPQPTHFQTRCCPFFSFPCVSSPQASPLHTPAGHSIRLVPWPALDSCSPTWVEWPRVDRGRHNQQLRPCRCTGVYSLDGSSPHSGGSCCCTHRIFHLI